MWCLFHLNVFVSAFTRFWVSNIKYGKWKESEVNNISAIELLEYVVILLKKNIY